MLQQIFLSKQVQQRVGPMQHSDETLPYATDELQSIVELLQQICEQLQQNPDPAVESRI